MTSASGARVQVTAWNSKDQRISLASSTVKSKSRGNGVAVKDKDKAKSKVKSCLKNGYVASGSVVAGAAVINIAAAWVPGVNVASAATTAVSAIAAGGFSYVVCLA
jgi:Trk-type K+ transport system membrane component